MFLTIFDANCTIYGLINITLVNSNSFIEQSQEIVFRAKDILSYLVKLSSLLETGIY